LGPGIERLKPSRDGLDFRFRLRPSHARFEPGDGAQEANLATPKRGLRRGGESEGEPNFHPWRILELWRHHADDSDIAVVEHDRLIDDGQITAEAPLPQPMTQHDDSIASLHVISLQPFFAPESPPDRRFP